MSMRSFALAVAAAALTAVPAQAGVYSDDLSKCLVKSMSPSDQTAVVRWIFSAMALHPDVAPYAKLTPAQHDAFDQEASLLMQRLLTVDCRKETVEALKYEGPASFEASFSTLGQVAMRGLMGHPTVMQDMTKFGSYGDKSKIDDLYKEAGVPPPAH
jgi:hypothetical protein